MPETVEFGSGLDVEVLGSLYVEKFEGRFPSPWKRVLYVDKDGTGDYTTIQAAMDAAQAAGALAAHWLRWTLIILPGEYTENVTGYDGVDMWCPSPGGARINGQLTQACWSTYTNLYIDAPTGSNWALHLDQTALTTSSARPRLINCIVVNNQTSVEGDVAAIRISGGTTPTPAIYGWRGCFLYAANRYTGSNPVARMQCVHVVSGASVHIEAFGGMHYKTSSGSSSGTIKSPTLALIESTNPCNIQSDGTWAAFYADDPANPPMFIRSLSTAWKGGPMNVGFGGVPGVVPGESVTNTTNAEEVYYTHKLARAHTKHLQVTHSASFPWSRRLRPSGTYGPTYATTKVNTVLTSGTMRASYFEVLQDESIVSVNLRVNTGAAGSEVRLMVFADDGYGRPGALVIDAGSYSTASAVTLSGAVVLSLKTGAYHLVAGASGGSPSVYMFTGASANVGQSTADSTLNAGYSGTYSGTAPSTFGTATPVTHAPFVTVTVAT